MTGVCCLKLSKLQACGSCFILVRKPLAMPVVPAVVPPLSSFRNSSSRPTTEARRGGCAVREGREPRARIAYRTRAGIARATWRGYRSVAGRCRAARPKGRSAGRPECRPAPGWWGAPAPTTHASASGLRPGAARATWWAGRRAWARSYRASGTMSEGALRAGIGRCGRGATTRAPSVPASRSPGGMSGGSPTGAAQGSGNAPDGARRQRPPARRGNAAVVTGPYGASLKSLATPGDLYCVLTWNSVPVSRTLNLDGMRTVVSREPIRVDSQMPRVPS